MPAKRQTDPDLLVQELQLARLILEANDWDVRTAIRMARRVMWEVFLHHFKWNMTHAARAAKVNRSHMYEMIARAGVCLPGQKTVPLKRKRCLEAG